MELECKEADSRDATVPGSMDGCTGTGAVYAGLGSRGAFIGGSGEGLGCEAVIVSLFGISFMANSCSSISGSWLCERDAGEGGMLGMVLLRFVGLSARDVRFDVASVAVAVLRCRENGWRMCCEILLESTRSATYPVTEIDIQRRVFE